jgi:hypothetical protein
MNNREIFAYTEKWLERKRKSLLTSDSKSANIDSVRNSKQTVNKKRKFLKKLLTS